MFLFPGVKNKSSKVRLIGVVWVGPTEVGREGSYAQSGFDRMAP